MDQMQASTIPHLLQVYQPTISSTKMQSPQIIHISHPSLQSQGKVTYQHTITSESLHLPTTSQITEIQNQQIHLSQNQIVMSCQQAHLQSMQTLQSQMPQMLSSDLSQQLQITSHVILPQVPVFKQMIVNGQQQYYSQFGYPKEQCIIAKVEPEMQLIGERHIDCKTEAPIQTEDQEQLPTKKRTRSHNPNPENWASNIRKMKHQRGEAYISRRGKYVPERRIKNTKDCLTNCKYKCNEHINDSDRERIFKVFYSLNVNEKKHFLLNTTERNYIKHNKSMGNHKRKYSFKYFFLLKSDKFTVCKNFYLGTLAISQKPIYNVHSGKSDMNIPKPDGRGQSEASTHAMPTEHKDIVRKHIMSFKTIDMKPVKQFCKKKQFLDGSMSIKHMYNLYVNECVKENMVAVKESMYRKIFKQEFNLHFKKSKSTLCSKCKGCVKKK